MAFFKPNTETMFRVFLLIVISFVAGISTDNCTFDVKVEHEILNEGFYRFINYGIAFNRNVNRHMFENCIIGLDQMLPAGVYADPDELEGLRRLQQLSAMPMNPVNVELSAEDSQSMRVFIICKLVDGRASTWLPVHARYQRAKMGGGFASNEIMAPKVYMRCPDQRLNQCNKTMTFLCNSSSREKCTWKFIQEAVHTIPQFFHVPVGNKDSYYLVLTVTACVVVGGYLFLLYAVHKSIIGKHPEYVTTRVSATY